MIKSILQCRLIQRVTRGDAKWVTVPNQSNCWRVLHHIGRIDQALENVDSRHAQDCPPDVLRHRRQEERFLVVRHPRSAA